MEAILNIVISVACVFTFGIVGVAIGTLVANVFRTIQYVFYMSRNVLKRPVWHFAKHTIIFMSVLLLTNGISRLCFNVAAADVFSWIITAAETTLVAIALTVIFDILFYGDDLKRLISKSGNMLKSFGKKKKKA